MIKNLKEINIIKKGSLILSKTHGIIASKIKKKVKTILLDKISNKFIKKNNAKSAFKGYKNFPYTLCISVNEEIVHGFPSNYIIKNGDIVSIDCGILYKGFNSDSAFTYPIGNVNNKKIKLLKITKKSLYLGIKIIKNKKKTGNIGNKIQKYIEKNKYSIVRELVGHGIGRKLHENPQIPNYGKKKDGIKVKAGMTLAIEPMVNLGDKKINNNHDWIIKTFDQKPSAHFEHTISITKNQTKILTTYNYIKKFFKF